MRKLALLLTVAVVASTAGCGFITGDKALSFSASPATVSEDARSQTGYEESQSENKTISRNFTVAGQTREVRVTNHLALYERSVSITGLGEQRASAVAVLSTPEVEVATQTFNPISELSNRELLARFSSQYKGLSVGQQVENRSMTILGQQTGVQKYSGSAQLQGTSVDVYIHVTRVKHEGDFVVALAVYPQQLSGEQERVFTMLRGIQH